MAAKVPSLRALGMRQAGGYDRDRAAVKASRTWYNSARWRKRRLHQLSVEPLCRYCWQRDGAAVVATVADHVAPHREDTAAFWFGELQSLCATCHSSVKQREERSAGGGVNP